MPRSLARQHEHNGLWSQVVRRLVMSDGMRSPRILAVSWGRIEVEGIGAGKDFKLYPGGGRECPAPLAPDYHKSLRGDLPPPALPGSGLGGRRPASPRSGFSAVPPRVRSPRAVRAVQLPLSPRRRIRLHGPDEPAQGRSPAYLDRTSVLRVLLHVSGPRRLGTCALRKSETDTGAAAAGMYYGMPPAVAVVAGGRVAGSTGCARGAQKGPVSSPRVSVSRRFPE